MDTRRAQQVIGRLLEAISEGQPDVVILDITGLPLVDTQVADHLLKTIRASRLLGTEAILTGVSPVNAQTLTSLGVDLSEVVTRGSLKAGLRAAIELLGESR